MAMIFNFLHIYEILFWVKQFLSITSSRLWVLGTRLFSCSTSISSIPGALLFLKAALLHLYSSLLNGYTIDSPTSVVGGSSGRFGLVDIVPLLLMSNWWATWFALTGVVGNISDSLPCFTTIVGHVDCCDDLLPSLLLLFFHIVYKCVTSLYSTVVKRVACILFL